ncbi:MAG: glycosyltransferase [Bilifractor sp.]|jgi:glycosyltransferase involved in cell wall biosynthesis
MKSIVLLIPAWNPNATLLDLVRECRSLGIDQITVVDDGSDASCQTIFQDVQNEGALLVHHGRNRGKGAAIRSGIRASVEKYGAGISIVTADADGQHRPEDIVRIAREVQKHPKSLILGTRNFNGSDVPKKSRWGNRFSSILFRLTTGVRCTDTQTGLRGIPNDLLDLALEEDGDRYEYEMNFLTDAVTRTTLVSVPISTIYENGNKGSHYRPVRDSLRVIGRFVRYIAASLIGAASDLIFFTIFVSLLTSGSDLTAAAVISGSTISARLLSGVINFLLNKYWSFHSRSDGKQEAVRYGILFLALMGSSTVGTTLLSAALPPLAAKLIVDTTLFFVSYRIQHRYVFQRKGGVSHETESKSKKHASQTLGGLV